MGKFRYASLAAPACALLLSFAGCTHQGQDEMSWARAALERNSALDIVATDQQTRTFTVRMKDTGELRVVRADEVTAAPAVRATTAASASDAGTSTAATGGTAQRNPGVEQIPPEPANSATAQAAPQEPAAAMTQSSSLAPQSSAGMEATSGRVLESGPGYTIKAASAAEAGSGRLRAASVTSAAIERRHEPIICQGARMLHIDNRNLVFDGDAVSAEDGCEIHITNSHISATGIGVSARAANVHIDNSLIEGDTAAIDASQGAQVYAGSSQFRGLSRRLDSATFHDLGGNIWN
jgi:hypothetical protein